MKLLPHQRLGTLVYNSDATPNEEQRYLVDFHYISKEIQKQMIPHLKALI